MTDNEIIKALEKILATGDAPVGEHWSCGGVVTTKLAKETYDMLNRQKAEIERLHKLQKPTETSGFKIENGKVVFYTNMLNGYRHEFATLDEVVKDLNLMLQNGYASDEVIGHYKGKLQTAKTEAIKEFLDKLNDAPSINIAGLKHYVIVETYFENFAKEMVGDGK